MDERPQQASAAGAGPSPQPAPPGREARAGSTEADRDLDPGLIEVARQLLHEGSAAGRSTLSTLQAVKTLAAAELALAKTALGRAAMMLIGAGLAALVAVFYLFATLSALLVSLGLGWPAALGIATLALLLITGGLAWRAMALSRMARFDATRRQLGRLREGAP
jgi:uncharacterized membrane protein YqjE